MTSELLRLIGGLIVRQVRARIREGKIVPETNKKKGTTLYQRGRLSKSIKYRIDGAAVVISAGSADVPYARIHHEGGVIRPKNAKYLAIPLTAQAKVYKPRDYPGETFIAKGIIFLKEGAQITPLYALKKQVTMPARPYMFLDQYNLLELEAQVKEFVVRGLAK